MQQHLASLVCKQVPLKWVTCNLICNDPDLAMLPFRCCFLQCYCRFLPLIWKSEYLADQGLTDDGADDRTIADVLIEQVILSSLGFPSV